MRILDLGCGNKKIPNAIGMDIALTNDVDIISDLNSGIPCKDNTFDFVNCAGIIEHVNDNMKIIEEIWRVLKPGGTVKVEVPHFSHINAWKDPTHKRPFALGTFNYFESTHRWNFYSKARFRILKRRLIYDNIAGAKWFYKPFMRFVQRIYDSSPDFSERFLVYYFGGASEIHFLLEAVKE